MKRFILLLSILFLQHRTYTQGQPVLVVQALEVKAISSHDIPDRVYDAITAAIKRCGDFDVRYNHHWLCKGCSPAEISDLEQEIHEILVSLYINRNRDSQKELKKLEEFKEKITTRVIVVGKLQRNGHSESNQYELVLHFVDLNSMNLVIPVISISFEAYEVEDFKMIEGRLLKVLVKEGFCDASSAAPRVPLTREHLEHTIEWLVRLEICFPKEKDVIEEVRKVRLDSNTNIMYLDKKAIAWKGCFEMWSAQEKSCSEQRKNYEPPIRNSAKFIAFVAQLIFTATFKRCGTSNN
jgi:hypothetical protein